MRIGINAALMNRRGGYRQTGISRYISELAGGLEQVMSPEDRLVLLGDSAGAHRTFTSLEPQRPHAQHVRE